MNSKCNEVIDSYLNIGLTDDQVNIVCEYLHNKSSDQIVIDTFSSFTLANKALHNKEFIHNIMTLSHSNIEHFYKHAFIIYQLFGDSFFNVYDIRFSYLKPKSFMQKLTWSLLENGRLKRTKVSMQKLTFYSVYFTEHFVDDDEEIMKPLIIVGYSEGKIKQEMVLCRMLDYDGEVTLSEAELGIKNYAEEAISKDNLLYVKLREIGLTEQEKRVANNLRSIINR